MPAAKPEILIWARETAGFSIEEAAAKLGIKDARGVAGATRLASLETGDGSPSRPLLLKMAKLYRRPLLVFYTNAPPPKGDRGEDFRSLPDRRTDDEPLVDALVRDIRARQSMVRAILEDEETEPLPFIGSAQLDDGIGNVLRSIERTLQLQLADFRARGSSEAAFAWLRTKAESAGVFVLLAGNLGSHHSTLDTTAFRGFALADPIAPFVVINDQDAKTAWSFTLLHELAHLWIGATGVSGAFAEGGVERFCNDVASQFLLPTNELDRIGISPNIDRDLAGQLIADFAGTRLLSRSLVAYRLFRAGLLQEAIWRGLTEQFDRERRQARSAQRQRDRTSDSGPSYYVVRRHRLGSALLGLVARNLSDGSLTPTKAAKVLGVKARSVGPLLSTAGRPPGRAA